ncbi:MAG: hypothetical protein JW917_09680 [Ignavibacteria bacterium]|nr:hypothetical protein [Ignavibacteria bacterium]
MKKIIFLLVIIVLINSNLRSQELSNNLGGVGKTYAEKYIEPFSSVLGASFNSHFIGGKMHTVMSLPFDAILYVGFKMSGTIINDDDRSFNLAFTDSISLNNTKVLAYYNVQNAPTIFGSTETPTATGFYYMGNAQYPAPSIQTIPGILNVKFYPFIIPQIGIGSFYGADLTLRFIPRVSLSNYGAMSYSGVILRYNLSYVFPKLPFNIAVQGGFQNISIENDNGSKYIDANGYIANIQASKDIFLFNIYGGFQYEYFNLDVNYFYTDKLNKQTPVSFSQEGDMQYRGVLGASFNIFPVSVNADISFGKRIIFGFGIGASL